MARTVREIMNRELLTVRADDSTAQTLDALLAMGVSGAPVVDEESRPLGVVSLSDVAGRSATGPVHDRMTTPAVTISQDAAVSLAAVRISDTGRRRLVVVDGEGRVVGMLSVMDVLRALIGEPITHPSAFPHVDATTGVSWTDDHRLEQHFVEAAPDRPGVLALVHGGAGLDERVAWAASTANLRTRLLDLISLPQDDAFLQRLLKDRAHLRFRVTIVEDPERRTQLLERLQPEVRAFGSVRNHHV